MTTTRWPHLDGAAVLWADSGIYCVGIVGLLVVGLAQSGDARTDLVYRPLTVTDAACKSPQAHNNTPANSINTLAMTRFTTLCLLSKQRRTRVCDKASATHTNHSRCANDINMP